MPPPLLGFNNNVRHKGRVFHIQTEDSGVKHPRIVTHLFADGGRIIKTTRTDYAEHVGRDDMADVVRALMKEQHKGMFIALRAGELDTFLGSGLPDAVSGQNAAPSQNTAPGQSAARGQSAVPNPGLSASLRASSTNDPAPTSAARRPISNPNLRKVAPSVVPPGPDGIELDVGSLDDSTGPGVKGTVPRAKADRSSRRPRPLASPAPSEAAHAGRYAASRPAAIFGEASRDNLFGDSVISEQSLDEVILSYLAEDLEGSQE